MVMAWMTNENGDGELVKVKDPTKPIQAESKQSNLEIFRSNKCPKSCLAVASGQEQQGHGATQLDTRIPNDGRWDP